MVNTATDLDGFRSDACSGSGPPGQCAALTTERSSPTTSSTKGIAWQRLLFAEGVGRRSTGPSSTAAAASAPITTRPDRSKCAGWSASRRSSTWSGDRAGAGTVIQSSAPTSRRPPICGRRSPSTRSGASSSPSPAPGATSVRWRPAPSATATVGSSTARRSGRSGGR